MRVFFILWFCFGLASQAITQDKELRLLFVGDIMGHTPQITSARQPDGSYDYDKCFRYVKPIISEADLAIGNLEVTLPGSPPYKGYPQFRSPDELAFALRRAGFDMLVTSNNHTNDSGLKGVIGTIKTVKQTGHFQTGSFLNQAERDALYPLIVYRGGLKLAFLNVTYGTNGLPSPAPTLVNMIDTAEIRRDLLEAKALQPDAIIMITHWGGEYQLDESAEQRRIADFCFRHGVDVVVGAHPHVIQPIKTKTYVKEGGETFEGTTVYSMGNFISNQKQPNTDIGLMVEMTIVKKEGEKKASIKDVEYIPVWRHIQGGRGNKGNTYEVIPISKYENAPREILKMTEADFNTMVSQGNKMRAHLNKHGGKERKIKTVENAVETE